MSTIDPSQSLREAEEVIRPHFSVIVPTFNRSHLLPEALSNLDRQTERDFEVVVVDDGSTDDTPAVLHAELRQWPWLRLIRRPNGGLSRARNTGAENSLGRYLVFLDDDDRPLPGWLAAFRSSIEVEGAAVTTCGARYVDSQSGRSIRTVLPHDRGAAFGNAVGVFLGGTVCFRADVFTDAGGYRPEQPTSHQTELMFRVLPIVESRGLQIGVVHEALIDIMSDTAAERLGRWPAERLLAGTVYLLETYSERLQRSPVIYSNYLAVAGTAAARLGDLPAARQWFRQAARKDPRNLKHLARWAVAALPALARRVWSAGPGG